MADETIVGVGQPMVSSQEYDAPASEASAHWTVRQRRDGWTALWFLLPGLVGLVVFLLVPLGASLALSFTNWQIMGKTSGVGFRNFVTAFATDPVFWQVLGNTVLYSFEYLVLNIVISIGMAVCITNLKWGKQVFRLVFFLPTFAPLVGSAVVWLLIFTPGGFMDWLLAALHIPLPNLITDTHLAMQAIVIMSLWSGFGYNLLLFGAALESIPQQYIDAAAIDGATSWQRFWRIKLPLISPSVFFGTVLTAITSLQVFDQVYALTRGGPGAATQTLGYKIYRDGFISYHFGYASSIAWILFVIIMALTAVQLRLQRKWVHYDG
jgi:multiple sugar transport system permease protein